MKALQEESSWRRGQAAGIIAAALAKPPCWCICAVHATDVAITSGTTELGTPSGLGPIASTAGVCETPHPGLLLTPLNLAHRSQHATSAGTQHWGGMLVLALLPLPLAAVAPS